MTSDPRTCWRRLGHTPLSDLLRGRVTGRFDLHHLLDGAGLPETVTSSIYRFARATRLRTGEQLDVARQLIEQAQQSLESGATDEEAVHALHLPGEVLQAPSVSTRRLSRARYTPLLDLLRGRLTARYCLRGVIQEAELPVALAELVLRICRRTRLSLAEQVDVARELAMHFQDGLAVGIAPEQLQAEFGDQQQAAQLIRRAKVRCRPVAWRIYSVLWRTCAAVMSMVIVLWSIAVWRMITATPTLKINLQEEYIAAQTGIAEEDRAWPEYRTVLFDLYRHPEATKLLTPVRGATIESRKQLDAYLASHQSLVESLRAATRKPRLGFQIGDPLDAKEFQTEYGPRLFIPSIPSETSGNPPAYRMSRPTWALRDLAKLLEEDARRARETKDRRALLADITALLRLARHCREGDPTPYGDTGAIATVLTAIRSIRETLTLQPDLFDDDGLVRLAHELAANDLPLTVDPEKAKLVFEDALQRFYTDDGNGNGILTAKALEQLQRQARWARRDPRDENGWLIGALVNSAAVLVADRRETTRMYNELVTVAEARMHEPYWRRQPFDLHAEIERRNDSLVPWTWRYYFLATNFPHVYESGYNTEYNLMRRDATQTALALELYRRRHGAWPQQLSQLVPEMLPSVPVDQFDGKPLRYRLVDGEPLLYSVGQNHTDDDGDYHRFKGMDDYDYPDWKPGRRADDWRLFPLRPIPPWSPPPDEPVEE